MDIGNIVTELFSSPELSLKEPSGKEYAEWLRLAARRALIRGIHPEQQANLRRWAGLLRQYALSLETSPVRPHMIAALLLVQKAPHLAGILSAPEDSSEKAGKRISDDLLIIGAAAQWLPNLQESEHSLATHGHMPLSGLYTLWVISAERFSVPPVRTGESERQALTRKLDMISSERNCGQWLLEGPPRTASQISAQLVLARLPETLRGSLEGHIPFSEANADALMTADLIVALHGLKASESEVGRALIQELRELAHGHRGRTSELTLYGTVISGLMEWKGSDQSNNDKRTLRRSLSKLREYCESSQAVIAAGREYERMTLIQHVGLRYGLPPAELGVTRVLKSDADLAEVTAPWGLAETERIVSLIAPSDWHALNDAGTQLLSGRGLVVTSHTLTPSAISAEWNAPTRTDTPVPESYETPALQAEEPWPSAGSLKA